MISGENASDIRQIEQDNKSENFSESGLRIQWEERKCQE
jgi:hypothetical protein